LWAALSEASQKPVNELMDLWVKQTGYPFINVTRALNDKNETVLRLRQERFFSNGSKPTEQENYLWKVPISIVTKSSYPNVHTDVLLETRDAEVNLGVLGKK
jgi:aminopeptidase 2